MVTDSYRPNTRVSNICAKKVLASAALTPPPKEKTAVARFILAGWTQGNDPQLYRDMNPCRATRNQTLQGINVSCLLLLLLLLLL